MIAFRVFGSPAPKGSKRAFVIKGKPVMVEANKGLGEWIQSVTTVAMKESYGRTFPIGGSWETTLVFYLHRPKSLRKTDIYPNKARNDIDKLSRAILDCLTGIVWEDDGQVIRLIASKEYATKENPPGVAVAVRTLI